MKSYIYIIVALILFFSCRNSKESKKSDNYLFKIPNSEMQNHYSDSILKLFKRVRYSEKLEPNGGGEYEKNKKTLFLEILEEMETHEKIVEHNIIYHNKNNDRLFNSYSFFINNSGFYNLIIENSHKYNLQNRTREKIKSDTFLFKKNKIYFWKNKEVTKKELLYKEKEILLVKREIDSILNK